MGQSYLHLKYILFIFIHSQLIYAMANIQKLKGWLSTHKKKTCAVHGKKQKRARLLKMFHARLHSQRGLIARKQFGFLASFLFSEGTV